ncbi:hypothetical protein K523DRAFT_49104 [Schizophyllum commune Tattone D]|nr:hypothetical protein K523DRAFT_49104 [Schizophyllum commune Tattone D]
MPVTYYYSPDLAATLYELARHMAHNDSVSIHSARSESRLRLPRLHLPRLHLPHVRFPSLSNRRGEARRAAKARRRASSGSGSRRTRSRSRRFYRWLDGIADGFRRRLGTLEHALLHRALRSGSRSGSVPRGRTGRSNPRRRARSGGSRVSDDHNDRAGREEEPTEATAAPSNPRQPSPRSLEKSLPRTPEHSPPPSPAPQPSKDMQPLREEPLSPTTQHEDPQPSGSTFAPKVPPNNDATADSTNLSTKNATDPPLHPKPSYATMNSTQISHDFTPQTDSTKLTTPSGVPQKLPPGNAELPSSLHASGSESARNTLHHPTSRIFHTPAPAHPSPLRDYTTNADLNPVDEEAEGVEADLKAKQRPTASPASKSRPEVLTSPRAKASQPAPSGSSSQTPCRSHSSQAHDSGSPLNCGTHSPSVPAGPNKPTISTGTPSPRAEMSSTSKAERRDPVHRERGQTMNSPSPSGSAPAPSRGLHSAPQASASSAHNPSTSRAATPSGSRTTPQPPPPTEPTDGAAPSPAHLDGQSHSRSYSVESLGSTSSTLCDDRSVHSAHIPQLQEVDTEPRVLKLCEVPQGFQETLRNAEHAAREAVERMPESSPSGHAYDYATRRAALDAVAQCIHHTRQVLQKFRRIEVIENTPRAREDADHYKEGLMSMKTTCAALVSILSEGQDAALTCLLAQLCRSKERIARCAKKIMKATFALSKHALREQFEGMKRVRAEYDERKAQYNAEIQVMRQERDGLREMRMMFLNEVVRASVRA